MVMYSNCQRIEVLSGDPTSKSRVSWMVEYHLHLVVFLELNILHTYTTCRHTYLCASDSLSFSYCWFCRWACISSRTNWIANIGYQCDRIGFGRWDAILFQSLPEAGICHNFSLIQLLGATSSQRLKSQYNWSMQPFVVYSWNIHVSLPCCVVPIEYLWFLPFYKSCKVFTFYFLNFDWSPNLFAYTCSSGIHCYPICTFILFLL